MRHARAVARACVLVACIGAVLRAQDAPPRVAEPAADPRLVQPERPSIATHAGTVATGYLEIETGVERDRLADGGRAFSIPTELKFGLGPRLQLSLQMPGSSSSGTTFGLGDVAAGVKWRLLDDDRWLDDFAVLPQIKFASGGARGTGTTDASLLLIDSRTLGPVGLDLNVGMTRRSGDGTRASRRSTIWTAAASIPLGGALGFALECSGLPGTSGPAGSPPTVALLAGPTLLVRRELALDAGVIEPIAGPQPRALYAGLVLNTGRVWPSHSHGEAARARVPAASR